LQVKAFNWEKEFPQIFAKGGFDVVIGNPPYVRPHNIAKEKVYIFIQNIFWNI
jgi:tRNA1(Val) A37 N6-methylase TrmN6